MRACISLFLVVALGFGADDGWSNLSRITRDTTYAVISRDGKCTVGSLISADAHEVVVRDVNGTATHFRRGDVARFAEETGDAHDAIYSGRSSWADLKESDPFWRESVRIVTRTGEELDWQAPKLSDDSITFKSRTIAKTNVRFGIYERFKPITAREHYLAHESMTILDPRLWFQGLMLGRIDVLLYTSDLPEDNSKLLCKP